MAAENTLLICADHIFDAVTDQTYKGYVLIRGERIAEVVRGEAPAELAAETQPSLDPEVIALAEDKRKTFDLPTNAVKVDNIAESFGVIKRALSRPSPHRDFPRTVCGALSVREKNTGETVCKISVIACNIRIA